MKELEKNELIEVEGGKVAYYWYPGDNGLIYFGAGLYNAAVSVRNFFGD